MERKMVEEREGGVGRREAQDGGRWIGVVLMMMARRKEPSRLGHGRKTEDRQIKCRVAEYRKQMIGTKGALEWK